MKEQNFSDSRFTPNNAYALVIGLFLLCTIFGYATWQQKNLTKETAPNINFLPTENPTTNIELEDLEQINSKKFLEVSSKIKNLTAHLNNTINDFRDLTSQEKVRSEFILIELVEEARKIIESEYRKYNINFIINTPEEYACKFVGYKRELLQVIINILNNAKDILIEKKIQAPTVVLSLHKNDNSVFLTIHDNAGGIPETIIEKIFDPYFTTKHESIGTGIGLFMSKKIIYKHFKGTLEVINEDGGAKFIISLPRESVKDSVSTTSSNS